MAVFILISRGLSCFKMPRTYDIDFHYNMRALIADFMFMYVHCYDNSAECILDTKIDLYYV